jgi:hypothetical protein
MRSRVILTAFTVLLGVTTTVFGADPFSGTWKLNPAKSSVNSGPIPPGVMITETIKAVANGITVMSDSTTPSGQKVRGEFTVKFDGKDYKAGDQMVSATKTDDFNLELKFSSDGKVMSVVKDVVSRDGKSRTSTETTTNPRGEPVTRILVYEKQ